MDNLPQQNMLRITMDYETKAYNYTIIFILLQRNKVELFWRREIRFRALGAAGTSTKKSLISYFTILIILPVLWRILVILVVNGYILH